MSKTETMGNLEKMTQSCTDSGLNTFWQEVEEQFYTEEYIFEPTVIWIMSKSMLSWDAAVQGTKQNGNKQSIRGRVQNTGCKDTQ